MLDTLTRLNTTMKRIRRFAPGSSEPNFEVFYLDEETNELPADRQEAYKKAQADPRTWCILVSYVREPEDV